MPTLALLFLVALATAAGTHVLQLRLERWHYDRTLATEWTISDRRGLAPPPRPATSSCHPHPAGCRYHLRVPSPADRPVTLWASARSQRPGVRKSWEGG